MATNNYSVSFDPSDVAPAGAGSGFILPDPGAYRAVISAMEPKDSKKHSGETTIEMQVSLTEGFEGAEIRDWCPAPVSVSGTEEAKKAATFGRAKLKAILLSIGLDRGALDAQKKITVKASDLLGKPLYVEVVHEESTKTKRDGTPFINAKVSRFLTEEQYNEMKGVTATAAPALVPAAKKNGSAGTNVSALLGR